MYEPFQIVPSIPVRPSRRHTNDLCTPSYHTDSSAKRPDTGHRALSNDSPALQSPTAAADTLHASCTRYDTSFFVIQAHMALSWAGSMRLRLNGWISLRLGKQAYYQCHSISDEVQIEYFLLHLLFTPIGGASSAARHKLLKRLYDRQAFTSYVILNPSRNLSGSAC